MRRTSFSVFRQSVGPLDYTWAMPQVVLDEVSRLYREELTRNVSKLRKSSRALTFLCDGEDFAPAATFDLDRLERAYRDFLVTAVQTARGILVPYPSTPHDTIAKRAIERRRPFSEDGKGYRDALVWETVLGLLRSGYASVVLVTDNKKDFAGKDGDLADDLKNDVNQAGFPQEAVVLYKSLTDLNQTYILPRLDEPAVLKERFNRREEGLPDLDTYIEDYLVDAVAGQELDAGCLFLPPQFESPYLTGVESAQVDEVQDVREMEDGSLVLTVTADLDCLFDVFIPKSDAWALEDDEVSVWDWDWNEHYVAAETAVSIWVEIQLVLERGSWRLISIELLDYEAHTPSEPC